MAAGLVYHNITTSTGVAFTVASWVPNTSTPDVGSIPVKISFDTTGAEVLTAAQVTSLLAKLDTLHTDLATTPAGSAIIGKVGIDQTSGQNKVAIVDISDAEYETVAASATAQVLGTTGGTGDYISGILVIPATTSPGVVTLLDNATSIPVFVGGTTSVSNLVPFFIPLGMKSVSGAWKITTGANVSCIGIGNFT